MLIYNHKKEFIGIDAIDLDKLGFVSLEDLILEAHDFADFFVKTPGFIHNFKHVNWIDFIACADSSENSKVIISTNSKNFQCNLSLETLYLTQDSSSKAFLISLINLRELSDYDVKHISVDLLKSTVAQPIAKASKEVIPEASPIIEASPPVVLDTPSKMKELATEDTTRDEPIDIDLGNYNETLAKDDLKIDLEEVYCNGYIFDPLVASSELGLPVDLIEEFIEDFVAQANDFKDELYASHNNGDKDQLKVLSHKLKGVAANLRIEDALESLSIINTSSSDVKIKEELDTFYNIISKLSSKEIQVSKEKVDKTLEIQTKNDAVELELEFKEDIPFKVEDKEVPQKIEMPELADDDFLLSIDEDEDKNEDIELVFEELETKPEEDLLAKKYDKDRVANEIGLDRGSFDELFEDYIEESQELVKSIATAIEAQNISTWKQHSIKLKGMSDNMRITNLSQEIEKLIQTQDSLEAKNAHKEIVEILRAISELKA